MEKKIEKTTTDVVLTFTTSGEEWQTAQKKEFNKLALKLNVPGFRKGHVPEAIAKKRISDAEVLHNAMMKLVNQAYGEAMNENKFTAITDPVLDVKKISKEELECTVSLALAPTVTLGEYKHLDIKKEEVTVTQEEIDASINKALEEHATLIVKEDAAALTDTVIIDFKGYIDSVPFEGGEAKAYELKLGSNSFIPGFEDQLVGIKAGEERSIKVTFPENYVENLAGKEATFDVKCHDVKALSMPTLDDEFVNELDIKEVKTVDEYKAHVENDLKVSKERQAANTQLDAIVNKAIDNAVVTIADRIITDEANAKIENIKKQVESNGLKFEDYLKINNLTDEQLLANSKAEAENNIKGMLVIEEICRQENIVVDSKALNDKYEELAKLYNMKVEEIRKALEPNKNEVLRNLKNELFSRFMIMNNAPAKEEAKEELESKDSTDNKEVEE